MLLTFAEVEFLVALADEEPALDVVGLLDEPERDRQHMVAAGLASLMARQMCAADVDETGAAGYVLDEQLLAVHTALHSATTSVKVTTVSPERTTYWLLLIGPQRSALTPVAAGVYAAVIVPIDTDVRGQVVALVDSALLDDPTAGVAISRSGGAETMSFRTNVELGGPTAGPADRRAAIEAFVDEIFVNQHPSKG
jgi:hypothetical protein